jgi:predicted DNA-binding protein YlxM (UPF0122 family)
MDAMGGNRMQREINHIDLFSGIGGFALSAKWAGFETIQFVEKDLFCQKVLAKNFPDIPIHNDIKTFNIDTNVNHNYNHSFEDEFMGRIKDDKYNNIKELYDSGLSIADCAEFFNVSRQTMHEALKRRKTVFRDNLKFKEDNHFYRGGKKATDRAHNLLEKALEKGIVTKKSKCEECSDTGCFADGRSKIQAHHDDYNKPLDVRWLCQKCHHKWHKNNIAIGETETHGKKITLLTGGFP